MVEPVNGKPDRMFWRNEVDVIAGVNINVTVPNSHVLTYVICII